MNFSPVCSRIFFIVGLHALLEFSREIFFVLQYKFTNLWNNGQKLDLNSDGKLLPWWYSG